MIFPKFVLFSYRYLFISITNLIAARNQRIIISEFHLLTCSNFAMRARYHIPCIQVIYYSYLDWPFHVVRQKHSYTIVKGEKPSTFKYFPALFSHVCRTVWINLNEQTRNYILSWSIKYCVLVGIVWDICWAFVLSMYQQVFHGELCWWEWRRGFEREDRPALTEKLHRG